MARHRPPPHTPPLAAVPPIAAAAEPVGDAFDAAAARGLRVGATRRALREHAHAVFRDRPPLTFGGYRALLDALLPNDDAGEDHVAWSARVSVGTLRQIRGGIGVGVAGAPPDALVRLARLLTLDLATLRLLVRPDVPPDHAAAVDAALVAAWADVPA